MLWASRFRAACIVVIAIVALWRGIEVAASMVGYAASYDAGRLFERPHEDWGEPCAIGAGYQVK